MKRKTIITKITAIGLAAIMLLGGCGSSGNGGSGDTQGTGGNSASTETGGEDGQVTLTVAVQVNDKGEYSDANYAIRWIQEQTGVNFEFVSLPSDGAEAETKLTLMLASDSYPDVICYALDKHKMVKFGEEGIFVPLNDLYEQYGDNMKNFFEDRPLYAQNAYAPDGNIYGFPIANECYHCTAYPKL